MSEIMVEALGLGRAFPASDHPRARLTRWLGRIMLGSSLEEERLWALRGIDLKLRRGEFFGVIGPNGAGKTTLLRLLSGLLRPSEGQVRLGAEPRLFFHLGAGLHSELSVMDNIRFCAALLGMSRAELSRSLPEILEFAEFGTLTARPLWQLSTGTVARLPLAVALHCRLDLLLVDELLAVGDLSFRAKCLSAFERLKREGKTVVVVSHDLDWVGRHCDRALWLEKGRAKEIGLSSAVVSRLLGAGGQDQKNGDRPHGML
ncbi:MAG: ATP-binding cassette domain-containing protein [Elusimicrobia bacterium]|nr:ATP-binding cassette domain-containing protein [Elusimicrobiota bacterium]